MPYSNIDTNIIALTFLWNTKNVIVKKKNTGTISSWKYALLCVCLNIQFVSCKHPSFCFSHSFTLLVNQGKNFLSHDCYHIHAADIPMQLQYMVANAGCTLSLCVYLSLYGKPQHVHNITLYLYSSHFTGSCMEGKSSLHHTIYGKPIKYEYQACVVPCWQTTHSIMA